MQTQAVLHLIPVLSHLCSLDFTVQQASPQASRGRGVNSTGSPAGWAQEGEWDFVDREALQTEGTAESQVRW